MDLQGKRIVLAGRFNPSEKERLLQGLAAQGATVTRSVSGRTTLVVVGEQPAKRALGRARELGVEVLTVTEVLRSLDTGDTANSRLSELRAILGDPSPSPSTRWDRVCDHFDRWADDQDIAMGLDYAAGHLEVSDNLRRTPTGWLRRAADGAQEARLSLCRCLYVYYGDFAAGFLEGRASAHAPSRLAVAARSRDLDPIRQVDLTSVLLDARCSKELAEAPLWRRVQRLSLTQCGVDDDGFRALVIDADAGSLREISVNQGALTSRSIIELAESGRIEGFEALRIGGNRIDAAGFVALRGLALPRLEALDLSETGLDQEGCAALAELELPALRVLNVSANQMGDGAGLFLVAGGMTRLEIVDVAATGLSDETLATIATAPVLTSATYLNASGNDLGPDGMAALASSPHVGRLRYLDLYGNNIGPDGAVALAQSRSLVRLGGLHLWNCRIGARGKRALLKAGYAQTATGGRWIHPDRPAHGMPQG